MKLAIFPKDNTAFFIGIFYFYSKGVVETAMKDKEQYALLIEPRLAGNQNLLGLSFFSDPVGQPFLGKIQIPQRKIIWNHEEGEHRLTNIGLPFFKGALTRALLMA